MTLLSKEPSDPPPFNSQGLTYSSRYQIFILHATVKALALPEQHFLSRTTIVVSRKECVYPCVCDLLQKHLDLCVRIGTLEKWILHKI